MTRGEALTLLAGGGLAAAGGLVSTLLTNWIDARRDKRKYKHEREMARDARNQERRAQAYVELLTLLSRQRDWAKSVQPFVGQPPAPDPLPAEERWRMEALVTAYGSREVLELLREWNEAATKIDNADATIRMVERSRNPSQQADDEAMRELKAMPDYRQAMFEADKAIRDRVQRELAGEA